MFFFIKWYYSINVMCKIELILVCFNIVFIIVVMNIGRINIYVYIKVWFVVRDMGKWISIFMFFVRLMCNSYIVLI